jgi:uncharacterized protein (TIGR02118 family)
MTVKAVTYFRRRPGLPVDDFLDHWQNVHAEKVVRMSGLRRYVQNPALPSSYADGRQPDFDGVAETWFDDTDALRALAGSEEYRAVMDDEAAFIDASQRHMLLTDEVVIKDGPTRPAVEGGLKYIAFIRRRPGLGVDEFQRYWREHHGPLAARNPYIRRYVQCHVRRRVYETGQPPAFDGSPMTWFDSFDDLRASGGTEELRVTRDDEANFMDDPGGRLPFLIATEREIPL